MSSLDWTLNENPITSDKMNKITKPIYTTTDRDALTAGQKTEGMLIYNITKGLMELYDGTNWQTVGGGMKIKLMFGNMIEIDPTDNIGLAATDVLVHAEGQDATNDQVGNFPLTVISVTTNGGAVATFTDSKEYQGVDPISLGGFKVGKVIVSTPIAAVTTYTSPPSTKITLDATNTKVEIIDTSTVKATGTLANLREITSAAQATRSVSSIFTSYLDLAGFVFTDFRVKVTIASTASTTTNLTAHDHHFGGIFNSEVDAGSDARVGIVEVELLS